MKKERKYIGIILRLYASFGVVFIAFYLYLMFIIGGAWYTFHLVVRIICLLAPCSLMLPIWFPKKRKKLFGVVGVCMLIAIIAYACNALYLHHLENIKINTDVNINTMEYLPFDNASKIVWLGREASLQLENNLPRVDGAAAVFPVYSAFVNAVYPNIVSLNHDPFYYSNTRGGYQKLADKQIDIFFGAYPSKEQIAYAEEKGTEFVYTEIGKEGFVFFVNKDNPVDSLTTEQIKGIYSGQITNWKEVGGKNEEIKAFQRNQGSGSQSMLIRFMGDTPIVEAPTEQVNDFMSGIIDKVADYRNFSNSIGFSFRYYLDTLIANPNVKMLKVDGVAPTKENISDGTYPIVTSLYAVTYEENPNENVQKLLDWILSDEGQEIVYRTGYAKAAK